MAKEVLDAMTIDFIGALLTECQGVVRVRLRAGSLATEADKDRAVLQKATLDELQGRVADLTWSSMSDSAKKRAFEALEDLYRDAPNFTDAKANTPAADLPKLAFGKHPFPRQERYKGKYRILNGQLRSDWHVSESHEVPFFSAWHEHVRGQLRTHPFSTLTKASDPVLFVRSAEAIHDSMSPVGEKLQTMGRMLREQVEYSDNKVEPRIKREFDTLRAIVDEYQDVYIMEYERRKRVEIDLGAWPETATANTWFTTGQIQSPTKALSRNSLVSESPNNVFTADNDWQVVVGRKKARRALPVLDPRQREEPLAQLPKEDPPLRNLLPIPQSKLLPSARRTASDGYEVCHVRTAPVTADIRKASSAVERRTKGTPRALQQKSRQARPQSSQQRWDRNAKHNPRSTSASISRKETVGEARASSPTPSRTAPAEEARAPRQSSSAGSDASSITVGVGFPSINSPILSTGALLDTGAIGGNTIVQSVADALVSLGLAEFFDSPTLVCNCNNECRHCTAKIKFTFGYRCERKGKDRFVTAVATVVADTQPYKFIIGRETIKEAHLAKRLPSHFFQISDRAVSRLGLSVPQLEVPLSRRKRPAAVSVPLSPVSEEGSTHCGGVLPRAQRRVDNENSRREADRTPIQPTGESTLSDVAGTRVSSPGITAILSDVAAINDSPAADVPRPPVGQNGDGAAVKLHHFGGSPDVLETLLVVSKAHLLQGAEDDDDEIDLPELPLDRHTPVEGFEAISIHDLEGDAFAQEQRDILRAAYDDGLFKPDLAAQPIDVEPMILLVDTRRWHGEARNRQPPRPQSSVKQEYIFQTVKELLDKGCIEPCNVPAFSQVHVVPKKDPGTWRFCVDFRALNEATQSHSWTIPNIQLMLQRLGEKKPKYFGVMDLTSGYWQMPIHEGSRAFTAFRTAGGCYQWKRVPMGLKGAGSYFQAQMCRIIGPELLYNGVEVYLDDVIVYGSTEREYLDNLRRLLAKFAAAGVRLSPAKCRFGQKEVEYVGHVINATGMNFSDAKKKKVMDFPKPVMHKQLKSFLGLGNYFRDHIRNYSTEVAPLQRLVYNYKRDKMVAWTTETEACFERVKGLLAGCQHIFWLDDSRPVYLHTDASDYGAGAYLFQIDSDGKERAIRFLSKSFSDIQKRWSTIEKECYAIFFALRDLEHLIRDRKFTLRTDHRNLLFLNSQASAKVTRWKLAIQEYDFDIEHIPGADNVVADHMSRLCAGNREEELVVGRNTVALCLAITHEVPSSIAMQQVNVQQGRSGGISSRQVPTIPSKLFKILSSCHGCSVGHGGVDRTIAAVKEYLSRTGKTAWPDEASLKRDVTTYIRQCEVCQKQSQVKPDVLTEPFVLSSDKLMQSISIDTMGPFPLDKDGNIYIIVIVDNFSRYVELVPAADCTAEAAAYALNRHIAQFGAPKEMLSDNGPQFVNKLIEEMATLYNTRIRRTMPYSHEENGIVERANKEVLRHLRAIMFERTVKDDWSFCTPLVQRIMNASKHSAHGLAPAQVVTPGIDLNQGVLYPHQKGAAEPEILTEFVKRLHERQALVIRLVGERLKVQSTTQRVVRPQG
jgi:hypothetical protein